MSFFGVWGHAPIVTISNEEIQGCKFQEVCCSQICVLDFSGELGNPLTGSNTINLTSCLSAISIYKPYYTASMTLDRGA